MSDFNKFDKGSINPNEVEAFLESVKDDFHFPADLISGEIVKEAMDKSIRLGNVSVIKDGDDVVSFMGYLFKEIDGKKIFYIYILVTSPKYRKTAGLLREIFNDIAIISELNNIDEIQFKALKGGEYNNKLYNKFAYKTEESINDFGMGSILFFVKAGRFDKYKKKQI